MSIYIKGMEMPKDCTECTLSYFDKFGYPHCSITRLIISYGKTKDDCPLIEVPESHGRLIDGDKLFDDEKLCYGVACEECQFLYETENFLESCCKVERMIYNAPTVIERSK